MGSEEPQINILVNEEPKVMASEKIRALNRFGLGARPGEVLGLDPKQWLRSQVISQPVAIQGLKLETTQKLLEEINSIRRDGMSVQAAKIFVSRLLNRKKQK